jgi:hypothetical protein
MLPMADGGTKDIGYPFFLSCADYLLRFWVA